MRAIFLHGFAGDPSVWDGICTDDDLAIALPGHATSDDNRAGSDHRAVRATSHDNRGGREATSHDNRGSVSSRARPDSRGGRDDTGATSNSRGGRDDTETTSDDNRAGSDHRAVRATSHDNRSGRDDTSDSRGGRDDTEATSESRGGRDDTEATSDDSRAGRRDDTEATSDDSRAGRRDNDVRATWDDNLAAIAAAAGGRRLAIGYSLGARVALGLLATGRVDRAILVGVNPGIADAERAARRAHDATWAKLLRTRGIAAFVDAWQAQPLFATQARVDPARLAARRARRLALDPEQLARSLEVMGLAEMPDYRAAVTERCSLIAGALDDKYVAIARTLPAPLVTIADSGHDPTLEQPAALAAAIARLR